MESTLSSLVLDMIRLSGDNHTLLARHGHSHGYGYLKELLLNIPNEDKQKFIKKLITADTAIYAYAGRNKPKLEQVWITQSLVKVLHDEKYVFAESTKKLIKDSQLELNGDRTLTGSPIQDYALGANTTEPDWANVKPHELHEGLLSALQIRAPIEKIELFISHGADPAYNKSMSVETAMRGVARDPRYVAEVLPLLFAKGASAQPRAVKIMRGFTSYVPTDGTVNPAMDWKQWPETSFQYWNETEYAKVPGVLDKIAELLLNNGVPPDLDGGKAFSRAISASNYRLGARMLQHADPEQAKKMVNAEDSLALAACAYQRKNTTYREWITHLWNLGADPKKAAGQLTEMVVQSRKSNPSRHPGLMLLQKLIKQQSAREVLTVETLAAMDTELELA